MPQFSYNGTITLSSSVKDLDASIAWFKEVLGFEEIFKVAEAGWAEVSTPADGVSIGLDQTDADVEGAGGSIPVLGVVDIDAARAELEGKGVEFAGEPGCWHGQLRRSSPHGTLECSPNRWPKAGLEGSCLANVSIHPTISFASIKAALGSQPTSTSCSAPSSHGR